MHEHEWLPAFLTVGVIAGVFVALVAIHVVICWLLYSAYSRVPASFRKLDPGLVWLLLIPCFSLIWNFFVFPAIGKSFKAYFDSIGRTDVGDCGEGIGLAYSILAIAGLVPYLGCLTGLAALVLLILFLVKIHGLKDQIQPRPGP